MAGHSHSPSHPHVKPYLTLDPILTPLFFHLGRDSNAKIKSKCHAWRSPLQPRNAGFLHHACGIHSSQLRWPQTQGEPLAQPQSNICMSSSQSRLTGRPHLSEKSIVAQIFGSLGTRDVLQPAFDLCTSVSTLKRGILSEHLKPQSVSCSRQVLMNTSVQLLRASMTFQRTLLPSSPHTVDLSFLSNHEKGTL